MGPPDGPIVTIPRHIRRRRAACELGALSEKWIDHRQVAEPPAVLEILAVERFAAGFDRGGEDQRIVNVETVAPGERDGELMRR